MPTKSTDAKRCSFIFMYHVSFDHLVRGKFIFEIFFPNAFIIFFNLSNIYFSGDVFLKKSNFECFCSFRQFIFKKQRLFCNWNYVYYYHILPKSLCLLHNFQDPSTELLLFGWKPPFRRIHPTFLRSAAVQVRLWNMGIQRDHFCTV